MPSNTGRKRFLEKDRNPNSPTYNQTRWGAYVSDPSACPPATRYTSAQVAGYVSRDNCPSGQSSSPVYYVVSAGSFTSYVSQADANQQAQAYFEANKQAYANQNGVCASPRSVAITAVERLSKIVKVTLTRNTSAGQVQVNVSVTADIDTGAGPDTDSRAATFTIPDGQLSYTGQLSFGGNVVTQVTEYQIDATTPSDYTF